MNTKKTKIPLVQENFFYHFWDDVKAEVLWKEQEVKAYFEPYFKIIPKLAMGEYYWQLFDNARPVPRVLGVGGAVDKLTPFTPEQYLAQPPENIINLIHPEDRPHALAFVMKAFSILFSLPKEQRSECNISIFCRIRECTGDYIWSVLQYPALRFDDQGNFLFGMALYSNVNHLMKPGQQPMLTFLNAFDHKQQQFTCFLPQQENGIELELPYITNRQKQIINLLAQGRPSKEIAHILKISKNTVDNHRQRLLKKFNVSSSAELVVKSAGLY